MTMHARGPGRAISGPPRSMPIVLHPVTTVPRWTAIPQLREGERM